MQSPQFTHRTLNIAGLRLHVVEAGTGEVPMVLLHGLGMDWRVWQSVARRLAPHFHLFLVDLRGHGQSDKPPSGYSLAHYASDVEGLVEFLELEHAVLVGSSLGGLVSVVVESPPEVISRRILVDPPFRHTTLRPLHDHPKDQAFGPVGETYARTENSDVTASTRKLFRDILFIKQSGMPASDEESKIVEALRADNPGVGALGLKYMAETWMATSNGVLEAALDGWGPQLRAALEAIDVPTLIMRGNPALGGVLSEGATHEVLTLIPHADIEYFERAGHAIHAVAPQLFVDSILDFTASDSSELRAPKQARAAASRFG